MTRHYICFFIFALQSLIFKDIFHKGNQKTAYNLPERTNKPDRPYDACRLHGSLTLNKVAGNFHITAGKSLHFSGGHIHISSFFDERPMNFSHRINRFSFGDTTSGIVHPLEGDEKILTESKSLPLLWIYGISFANQQKNDDWFTFRLNIGSIFHRSGSNRCAHIHVTD